VVNSAGMLAGSSVIMLPLVLMTSPLDWSQPSARAIAAILGLATVSTALAYLLYFRILASAGATNALLVTFLIPVSALLLGVGVLGEVINILEEMLKTFKLIAHS
jgi:drug/metabolite transporter (DMT)-like permease